jgi:hypothetical protein
MKLQTNLSLSGAMRRGHEIYPRQIKGKLYGFGPDDDGSEPKGACALGHALGASGMNFYGATGMGDSLGYIHAADTWPVYNEYASCPVCPFAQESGMYDGPKVGYLVYHLNDFHSWTVDEIADWVRLQEQKLAAKQSLVLKESIEG